MKYTESHEWIDVKADTGTVGVTDYAQDELGDIVYVELPEVGRDVEAGDEIAVLESTKAAADIYAPVSGRVIEVNEELKSSPNLINESSEEEGWIFKIKLADKEELNLLMDESTYKKML